MRGPRDRVIAAAAHAAVKIKGTIQREFAR
jgi:hypothetical protein